MITRMSFFFLEGDQNLINFDALLDRFGDNDYLVIGIPTRPQDRNLFNGDTLRMIADMTEFLEDQPMVTKVSSLSKYQYTHARDDSLSTDYLIEDIEELDDSRENMDRLANIMSQEVLVHNKLITKDLKHTIITAKVEYKRAENAHKVKLVQDFNQFVKSKGYKEQGFDIHKHGNALIAERFQTVTIQDQSILQPLNFFIILALLWILFRCKTGVVFPFLVIFGTLILVTGIQGFFHWPFNSVNTALPSIIIIMGIGDSVHIIVEFLHFRSKGCDPKQAAEESVKALWFPCFFTSMTTAIGFSALAVTRLLPIRILGALGALAAIIAFLISVILLPAILSFIKGDPKKAVRVIEKSRVSKLTPKLVLFSFNNRKPMVIIGVILLVIGILGVTKITVDTNYVGFFKKDTPVRQSTDYFDKHFKSVGGVHIMIDSGTNGGAKNPAFLKRINQLQQYLERLPETGRAISVLDYIKKMNQAMHNDDPAFYVVPETREMVAQLLLLYENSGPEEDLSDFKTVSDERYIKISLSFIHMSGKKTDQLIKTIRNEIETNYPDLKTTLAGGLVMFTVQNIYVSDGMIQSFGLALVFIGICLLIQFRSIKYGILALIPSVFPIIFTGAILALLGIELDMGTMVVAAMTMGIAVDDTIHVMNRYLTALKEGCSVHESVGIALNDAGRAVIFTTIILVSGFGIMVLGSFIPFIYTGLFSASIMLMALLSVMIILPSVLFLIDSRKNAEPNQKDDALKRPVA